MSCNLCPVAKAVCNPLLRNNGTGDTLIVVSSPDKRDDMEGTVYAAKHGRILTGLLDSAGITSYTITSATLCAPTEWLKGDHEQCRTHLIPLIQSRKWKSIVALGNVALKSLTKKSGVKKNRGRPIPIHAIFGISETVTVLPTYGLEDLMDNPMYKNIIIRDLRNSQEREESGPTDFVYFKKGMLL